MLPIINVIEPYYSYFWAMENGEQKIFVWCDFTAEMDNAVLHGMTIALTLKKELCLFHHLDTKHHENLEIAEARLSGMASKIAPLLPNYPVKYIVLQTTVLDALKDLAERYECLALVAPKTASSKLLPLLEYALFPFLFVSAKTNIPDIYKRVVVPVGYMKKSKDLALWASYIGRHNGATVDVFVAEESGAADQNTVRANLFSVNRLFGKFSFPYQVIESHSATWRLQRAALLHSLGLKHGMLMIAATFSTTFIDTLLGLTESKVIAKSGDLSVMCINSRRDFYTFCC